MGMFWRFVAWCFAAFSDWLDTGSSLCFAKRVCLVGDYWNCPAAGLLRSTVCGPSFWWGPNPRYIPQVLNKTWRIRWLWATADMWYGRVHKIAGGKTIDWHSTHEVQTGDGVMRNGTLRYAIFPHSEGYEVRTRTWIISPAQTLW